MSALNISSLQENEGCDFNDSFLAEPISLKPSVIPSLLNKSNPETTSLATYDKFKLTDYTDSVGSGRVIELVSLEEKSLQAYLTEEGAEFLARLSGYEVAFASIVGSKGSGKSFFLDKTLNLANVQGNNFCQHSTHPSINVWSQPFVNEDLRIFLLEVSNCSIESKQFGSLFPFMAALSSTIVSVQKFEDNSMTKHSQTTQLDLILNSFLKNLDFGATDDETSKALLRSIFPNKVISLKRTQGKSVRQGGNSLSLPDEMVQFSEEYLPDAKNREYRGNNSDLQIHSFMNKNCISEDYVTAVSKICSSIFVSIKEKTYKELSFNGSVILKYLNELEPLFNQKRRINLEEIYTTIMKDMYISAYNYCVISYHEELEQNLSDERPRSIEELLEIFETATEDVLEKYSEFTIDQKLHEEFEEKLLRHIESKEELILEINRKKTDLELSQIYKQQLNINDVGQLQEQIQRTNAQNPHFTHGRDQTLGRFLAQAILKLGTGNNVDYMVQREVERLKEAIRTRKQELDQIKKENSQKNSQEKVKKDEQKGLENTISTLEGKIAKMKRDINIYQHSDEANPAQLKEQLKKQEARNKRNQEILEKLRKEVNEPVDQAQSILQLNGQIEKVKNKQELLEHSLQEMKQQQAQQQKEKGGAGKSGQPKGTQSKIQKEAEQGKPPKASKNPNKKE